MNGKEKEEIEHIEQKIGDLYDKIYAKKPSHFRKRDIINSFFASFVLGLVFIFKGSLVEISINLKNTHLALIVFATVVMLSLEIYFVGYTRVGTKEREQRKLGQFWAKRFFNLYIIALLVPLILVYLFDLKTLLGGGFNIIKVVIAVSMPCAIGAAIPSLLKQY